MKLIAALCLAVAVSGAASPAVGLAMHGRSTSMSVKILPQSGPLTITTKKRLVTLYLQVTGMKVDKITVRKLVAGHGHVQIYLDKIPKDAQTKRDEKGMVSLCGVYCSVGLSKKWIGAHKGQHKLLVALARNNYVLYPVAPATFHVTVK